jgi:ABC-type uncharacterized transport system permease subunit
MKQSDPGCYNPPVPGTLVLNLLAVATLVPATIVALRRGQVPLVLAALALIGAFGWTALQLQGPWPTGFSAALWLTIAATLGLGAVLAAFDRRAASLAVLMFPYLAILGLLATTWSRVPASSTAVAPWTGWFLVHVLVAVGTYALATLAALAGLAVLIQQRALKARQPSAISRLLPAVSVAEALEFRLLVACEIVLGLGLVTGTAIEYLEEGTAAVFDHKTVLSVLAFGAIGVLLLMHRRTGLRGRRAAHWALAGYLLLTLAYPGVKFVRDVLLT